MAGLENRNNYIHFYSTYINIYSILILSTWCHDPYLLIFFHCFLFFGFLCHHQTHAMMMSSKMNCGAVHASLHIAKCFQALIDTTINRSPDVSKKKHCGASKHKRKGGGGPKPPVGVISPPPSPPSKEVDATINKGWLLLLLCFLSLCFYFVSFDCCACACYSRKPTFLTSRWLSRLVFACFIVVLLFVHCCSPFSIGFTIEHNPMIGSHTGGLLGSSQVSHEGFWVL